MEAEFSLQQAAQQTGLRINPLRYYERTGLLEAVNRAPSGHRRYRQADIDWIGLVMRLRASGMPLAQIRRLAQSRREGSLTIRERRLMLEQHQQVVEQQIRRLQQHLDILAEKIVHNREREAALVNVPGSSPSQAGRSVP
jgi:DNA-binding transcriptional MerR regulator